MVGVAVTRALVMTRSVFAVQTSASPRWVFARPTRCHASPAPWTTADWAPDAAGPSEETSASSTSSPIAVWKRGVLTALRPRALTSDCTTKQVIGGAGFSTRTIWCVVETWPAVSTARAVTTWRPEAVAVVFHRRTYGALVTGGPRRCPST